jgi:hypothetical protein
MSKIVFKPLNTEKADAAVGGPVVLVWDGEDPSLRLEKTNQALLPDLVNKWLKLAMQEADRPSVLMKPEDMEKFGRESLKC